MTDQPITTPAEALEAAAEAIADELVGTIYLSKLTQCQAAIRALAGRIAAPVAPSTPAAKWRVEGQPDPHGTRYDCERAKLSRGDLTDDEMANAIYMADRNSLDLIVWQEAAKDRIRWLSRALEKAQTIQPAAQAVDEAVAGAMRAAYEGLFKHANGTTVLGGQSYRSLTLEVAAEMLISITPKEAFAELDKVHNLAVAGAYAAARNEADTLLRKWVDRAWSEEMERAALNTASGISDRIRNLTPADAQAALARRDAETRKAALREALDRIGELLSGMDHGEVAPAARRKMEKLFVSLIKDPAHD